MKVSKKISITIKQTLIIFSPDSFFLKMYGYRRGYKRYYGKKYAFRRTYGASTSGTKRVSVSIPIEADGNFNFSANSKVSQVVAFKTPDNLATSATYQAYSQLYDEARVVGVTYKLIFGGGFTNTGTGFFTFYSCVDRIGTSDDVTNRMTADEVKGSSSTVRSTFTIQQRLGATRSYFASNLLEKNTWWDCTVSSNTIPELVSSTTAFKPLLQCIVETSASSSSSQQLPYRLMQEIVVQFRNPKLKVTGNSKFSELVKSAIEEGKEEEPVLKKKKVVYEEEVLPDDEEEEMDEDEQEPLTQPLKPAMKKAGKKSS